MESAGNEYVAQLLDRAATLIQPLREDESVGKDARDWFSEYQAEKARFGQPLGSPAYVDAVQAARGGEADGTLATAQRAEDARIGDGATSYEDWTLEQLSDEAKRRGLPSSGTKADVRGRLEEDDTARNG